MGVTNVGDARERGESNRHPQGRGQESLSAKRRTMVLGSSCSVCHGITQFKNITNFATSGCNEDNFHLTRLEDHFTL